jgi:hypothetical protein
MKKLGLAVFCSGTYFRLPDASFEGPLCRGMRNGTWPSPRCRTHQKMAVLGGLRPGRDRVPPLPHMSNNRQGEFNGLTSEQFNRALEARSIQLITYRQLIAKQGLVAMRRPAG